jgi:4-amino-4-deoxy-L-arabinose transferase-like glycosyltransferase
VTSLDAPALPETSAPARPPVAWREIAAIAAVAFVLLVAVGSAYDYHRDELYFRLLGEHPAWGYADQPPATPLLARATVLLLGDHLWALRLPAALCAAGAAVLTALLARELGGRRGAQVLAAASAGGAFPLIFGHVLLTASLDLVLGAAILLFVARALLRDERAWLVTGALVGLSLYNKHLIVLSLLAVAAGLLLIGPRRALLSCWLWLGVGLAIVVGLPNIVYQATHDWPQLAMAEAIERDKGEESRILFVPLQFALLGFFLVPVWVAGLVRLLREPALRAVRSLAVAYPVACVLVLVTGGQPYYTLALVLALYAAGCEPVVRWLGRGRARRWWAGAALAANLAVSALVALPLLPVSALASTPIPAMNQATSDQIGWPVYVRQITGVYRSLPPQDAAQAVIITSNYGEAGALDRYGPPDLPAVYSGHNELWFRGRPPDDKTVAILVGFHTPLLSRWFASCTVAAQLDNGADVPNEEQDYDVKVCRDPARPASQGWSEFQHYS